jgi:hypothetical protein
MLHARADLRAPAALQPDPAHRRVPGQPLHQGGDEGEHRVLYMEMLYVLYHILYIIYYILYNIYTIHMTFRDNLYTKEEMKASTCTAVFCTCKCLIIYVYTNIHYTLYITHLRYVRDKLHPRAERKANDIMCVCAGGVGVPLGRGAPIVCYPNII